MIDLDTLLMSLGHYTHCSSQADAIASLQKYQGQIPTGEWCGVTEQLATSRRCGCPDILPMGDNLRRWDIKNFRIWTDMTLVTPEYFLRACNVWAEVLDITFELVGDKRDADIFAHQGRIDGRNGTLAYAYLPHTPSSRPWQSGQKYDIADGSEIFWTIVHEVGHSLGLSHSQSRTDIMFFAMIGNESLGQGDIREGVARYDKRTTPIPTPEDWVVEASIILEGTPHRLTTDGEFATKVGTVTFNGEAKPFYRV